jgi:hypothetical protein
MRRLRSAALLLQLVALSAVLVTVAEGAVASAGSAAKALPARKKDEVLPDFVARPFDEVLFSWGFRYDAATKTEYLIGQFNFTVDEWVGIGFQSPKRMNGPIMICWIAANRTDVNCNDYEGNNYDPPQPRSDGRDLTDPVQAGVADSGAANYIRFETIAGTNVKPPLDSNSTMPDYSEANFTLLHNTGFTRVIFGKGGWYDAFSGRVSRKQHDTDSSIALSIDWRSGKKEKLDSNLHRIVFYELAGIALAVIVVSLIEKHPALPRSPIRRIVYMVLCVAIYLALLAQYIYFRYLDYKANVVGKAQMRCFGDGAVFCLGTMALPVSKKLFFSNFFLCSHERAIKYHAAVGCLLVVMVLVHGIGMYYFYEWEGVSRWKTKDEQSRLPGLLTAITIFFVVIPAFLRHFFWRTFRLLHYTYILVFFGAMLHYPYAGVALAPGAVLHLAAFATRRFLASQPSTTASTAARTTPWRAC